MSKVIRVLLVSLLLAAFGSVVCAQEFFVVKDTAGKVIVADKKPEDAKSIVKGPFKTKDEADKAAKASAKPKLPDQGC